MNVPIEDVALFCGVHDESGRMLASSLQAAAEEELDAAGIQYGPRNQERYGLAVKNMVFHELEHPGEARPEGLKSLINGLKYGGNRHGS